MAKIDTSQGNKITIELDEKDSASIVNEDVFTTIKISKQES